MKQERVIPDEYPQISDWPDLPSNCAAECAILGHILLDNAVYAEVKGKLNPDDFSLDSNRRIFLRIIEMFDSKRDVDLVTLANYMAGKLIPLGVDESKEPTVMRELDYSGGVAYLAGLTEGLHRYCARVHEYVAIIKEKTALRRIIAACSTAIKVAEGQGDPAAEIVAQLGVALKGISGKAAK